MSQPILDQPWQVRAINGQMYAVARDRAAVLLKPETPARTTARLLQLSLEANGLGGPVVSPGIDRSSLPALYGKYKLPSVVPADYRQSQAGARNRMADLNEWNSPDTQDFQWPTGISSLTIQNAIVYGRFVNPPYPVHLENVISLGPKSFIGNESAVWDFDNPTTRQQSVFLDVTVAPRFPQPRLNAFKGSLHKCERVHAVWCVDAWGPYTKKGYSWGTNVEVVGSRAEALVYFPGPYYASHSPWYWNGAGYQSSTSGAVARSTADMGGSTSWVDYGHGDGNHSDGCEGHGGRGSHTYDPSTNRWAGDGVHFWSTGLLTTDAYDYDYDPTGLGIPVPVAGTPGAGQGTRGWGDNPKRGLPDGGQRPGQARPNTAVGTRRQMDGQYSANGSGFLVLQLENQLPDPTTYLMHDIYVRGGNMGLQEQRKAYPSIQFTAYDWEFGPGWFPWGATDSFANLNQYPVRINDVTSLAAMPGVVDIYGRPTGHPAGAAPWYQTFRWDDPADFYNGQDGQLLPFGRNGIRFG
ncbi:hypothetical protein FDO65_10200 [Nakamurella flava]|uniref:Uncharacterized protein n=1 Tax=Nakamurella flava TaxID=2576308 RepID=A0A4U6QP86_9ACTN|nr:hypothetical protein [Nakamurella flava]TKV61886.1 hypothetical protein FDO65_10200 [Nakamurella flava]